jgi:myo-inositol catabolism protein IolC
MTSGYDHPLYLLPFDHRHSYVTDMFGFHPPLTAEQHAKVAASKQVIYEGFCQAVNDGVPVANAGILVDEEFGTAILRDAAKNGYITALSVEKSGSDEFEFEYGDAYASHIEAFRPTFAKVLVRYNVDDDKALNRRQAARLKQLSDYCRGADQRFMFELLVPATKAQLAAVQGDALTYDLETRPAAMIAAIRELQDAGIEPDIWKIEGLALREDCERLVATVQRDGRGHVSCIVLGRGADEKNVVAWLETAASVAGFIGFAVGRTTFWDAIADYEAKKKTQQEAVLRIAGHYRDWVAIFTRARAAATGMS